MACGDYPRPRGIEYWTSYDYDPEHTARCLGAPLSERRRSTEPIRDVIRRKRQEAFTFESFSQEDWDEFDAAFGIRPSLLQRFKAWLGCIAERLSPEVSPMTGYKGFIKGSPC